ncbi:MAG TPA: HK97 family phage prohead protease [Solirubrobacterales bacterium]
MGRCVPWRPKCLRATQLAREAWRSVKKNRVGLSFGYLVTDDLDRSDGVKELLAIDLFEITLTGVPANADARVLSTKSMQPIQVATFEC